MNFRGALRSSQKALVLLLLSGSLMWTPYSFARETIQSFSIEETMSSADGQAKLGGSIKFSFGTSSIGNVARSYGNFHTNKKTNAFGKSDERACKWGFLSAMISLRDRAVAEGGNAVINIRSNYKNNTTSSESTFQCGAGNVIAGVALIGEVVTLSE